MKAEEYFEKYDSLIIHGDTQDIYDLFTELKHEAMREIKARKIVKLPGIASVMASKNSKWNVISNLFKQKYEKSPLKPNGFANFVVRDDPKLLPYFKRWLV